LWYQTRLHVDCVGIVLFDVFCWDSCVQLHLLASHCPVHTNITSAPWLLKLPSQSSWSAHLCLWQSMICATTGN
jgi:hypothetical protein